MPCNATLTQAPLFQVLLLIISVSKYPWARYFQHGEKKKSPINILLTFVDSLPRRDEAVIAAKGGSDHAHNWVSGYMGRNLRLWLHRPLTATQTLATCAGWQHQSNLVSLLRHGRKQRHVVHLFNHPRVGKKWVSELEPILHCQVDGGTTLTPTPQPPITFVLLIQTQLLWLQLQWQDEVIRQEELRK